MEKLINWSDEYSICPMIDEQHKKLIDIINELFFALMEGKACVSIENIIKELHDYTVYHFSTEEKMFEEKNYEFTEEHKAEHTFFVNKIKEFRERFNVQDSALFFDIMNFLKDWLLNHIAIMDKKYSFICN